MRHQNDNFRAAVELFEVNAERPDTSLCVLPLFRAFAQVVIQNGAIALGGTLVFQTRFEARAALQLMLDHDVTFFGGVPAMYRGLLRALSDGGDAPGWPRTFASRYPAVAPWRHSRAVQAGEVTALGRAFGAKSVENKE